MFLFYGQAMDPTIVVALGNLETAQTNGIHNTDKKPVWFLNYCTTTLRPRSDTIQVVWYFTSILMNHTSLNLKH